MNPAEYDVREMADNARLSTRPNAFSTARPIFVDVPIDSTALTRVCICSIMNCYTYIRLHVYKASRIYFPQNTF